VAGWDPKEARMRRNFVSSQGIAVVQKEGGPSTAVDGSIVMNLTARTTVARATRAPTARPSNEVTYL
jgi:hypothetical protein